MATLAQCQREYDAKVPVGHSLPDEYWEEFEDDYCNECGFLIDIEGHAGDCSNFVEEGD